MWHYWLKPPQKWAATMFNSRENALNAGSCAPPGYKDWIWVILGSKTFSHRCTVTFPRPRTQLSKNRVHIVLDTTIKALSKHSGVNVLQVTEPSVLSGLQNTGVGPAGEAAVVVVVALSGRLVGLLFTSDSLEVQKNYFLSICDTFLGYISTISSLKILFTPFAEPFEIIIIIWIMM